MSINDLIEKFTIDIEKDIKPNFRLTKKLHLDAGEHKGCFNCNDTFNQSMLNSEPWTLVQYCWACNHLNVVICEDRMGGIYTDVIECYTEK